MTREDLKKTKIYLSNIEDRKKFYEKSIELKLTWYIDDEEGVLNYEDSPFFFISKELEVNHGPLENKEFFRFSKFTQIFLEDILDIKEIEEKYEFKPFEKVLVREDDFLPWRPGIFSYLDNWNGESPYVIIPQESYKYCIPYEGNEHLCGVNN